MSKNKDENLNNKVSFVGNLLNNNLQNSTLNKKNKNRQKKNKSNLKAATSSISKSLESNVSSASSASAKSSLSSKATNHKAKKNAIRAHKIKSTKSKTKNKEKDNTDDEFSSVRLTVKAISRLNAYQKVSGLRNRSEALNKVLNKALPQLLNHKQKVSAKVIENLFEDSHNGNTK